MWNSVKGERLLPEVAELVSVTRGHYKYLLQLVTPIWTWCYRERTIVLPPLDDYHFGDNIKRPYILDIFQ